MDAIEVLTDQHFEIESVFDQFETALRTTTKRRLCRKLADLLAVHTAVEERIFYPAVRRAAVSELLPRAFEEHSSAERMIAELVGMTHEVDDAAMAKMSALKERKTQHAREEERKLFPRARELLTRCQLEMLGRHMERVADELMRAGARERITALTAMA